MTTRIYFIGCDAYHIGLRWSDMSWFTSIRGWIFSYWFTKTSYNRVTVLGLSIYF